MAKRGPNEGSVYRRRSDGRWVAAISLGWRDGRRVRKLVYGRTRREVQEALTRALRDLQMGLPLPTERPTLREFLECWLRDVVSPHVRPKTYRTYADLVRLHLIPSLGAVPLDKLTPQVIQAFLNEKLAFAECPQCREKIARTEFEAHWACKHDGQGRPRRSPLLSARTVKHMLVTLRSALNVAVRWNLVPRNNAALVQPPRASRPELRTLTPEEARRFLGAVRGHRLEALFTVGVSLGLRQGEILGLEWSDVDWERGTLTVSRALQRVNGKLQLVEPKTRAAARTLVLPSVALCALSAHKARQEEERLAAGSRWQETGLIFTTTVGTPIEPRNLIRCFHQLLRRHGLPRIRFHDLRHSCATLLLAQGVAPRYVAELLGHTQVSFTMQTYAHVLNETKGELARKMDQILASVAVRLAVNQSARRPS